MFYIYQSLTVQLQLHFFFAFAGFVVVVQAKLDFSPADKFSSFQVGMILIVSQNIVDPLPEFLEMHYLKSDPLVELLFNELQTGWLWFGGRNIKLWKDHPTQNSSVKIHSIK